MSDINKEEIQRLSELARVEISAEQEDKFIKEFDKILAYFGQLQNLQDRKDSILQGTKTELRSDEDIENRFSNQDELIKEFPEKKDRYLKIPPIFERE